MNLSWKEPFLPCLLQSNRLKLITAQIAMSIEELERAVSKLPPDELAEFSQWFDAYREQGMGKAEQEEKQVTFEDIKHLAGIGDGPGDLSTNPTYMDDFGQRSMR